MIKRLFVALVTALAVSLPLAATNQQVALAENASATTTAIRWPGGPGMVFAEATWAGATAKLQIQSPNGTWVDAGVSFTANGQSSFSAPQGDLRILVSAGPPSALYVYAVQNDGIVPTPTSGGVATNVTNTGTFAVQAAQSGTWTVQPGNTANTTAWKVDGSAVTQPVSIATAPVLVAGSAVIGKVSVDQTTPGTTNLVAAGQNGTWTVQPGNTANTTAWKVDGSAVTQPVSIATAPVLVAGSAVIGKVSVDQTTPGTTNLVAAGQNGTWTVQPGNTANTTAWKVDGSAVTQPASVAAAAGSIAKAGNDTLAITDTGVALLCGRRDALSSLSSATAKYLQLQCDKWGALFVHSYEKHSRTYSATVNVAAAASATDIAYMVGNATSPIMVTKIIISGVQTTAAPVDVTILTRSTANSAGTCTAATMVPHDPGDSAAAAVVTSCTANPTTGTLVGAVRRHYIFIPGAATATESSPFVFDFGKEGKPITLTTSVKTLAVNLGGITVTGGTFSITFEWIENP